MKKNARIGIDIRPYLYDKSGIGQYILQLTTSLLEIDTTHTYILFADRDFDLPLPGNYRKKLYTFPIPKLKAVWYHICTILFAKRECDVYLTASSLYVPTFRKNFAILVIHDLVMLTMPHIHTKKVKFLARLFLHPALKGAKQIIAVSENTKKDILTFFPDTDSKKVSVIFEGVNKALLEQTVTYDPAFWEETKTKFGITGRYILNIGTIHPRKNIGRLITAYEQLSQELPDVQLVIVGRKGWQNEELDAQLNTLPENIRQNIIITGFVSEKEKAYFLKNAAVFAYPSLYEGFGIPVLEAMLFTIPLLTSKTSSLPEVAGDAGILVDPLDSTEIYQGLHTLLLDTKRREDYQTKEKERIQLFDWHRIATQVISLYDL